MSPDPLEVADGLLIEGLTIDEWRVLDDFEDNVYDLSPLHLVDGRNGWAYVCPERRVTTSEPWDYDAFARRDLSAYVRNCQAWLHRRTAFS